MAWPGEFGEVYDGGDERAHGWRWLPGQLRRGAPYVVGGGVVEDVLDLQADPVGGPDMSVQNLKNSRMSLYLPRSA